MPYFPLKQRLKIAIGGFISFVGFMLLILVFLTVTGAANLESVIQSELVVAVAIIVAILDIICGLLLFRKR